MSDKSANGTVESDQQKAEKASTIQKNIISQMTDQELEELMEIIEAKKEIEYRRRENEELARELGEMNKKGKRVEQYDTTQNQTSHQTATHALKLVTTTEETEVTKNR
ncbi:hypothetical protein DFA_10131 [Cavenderia fasciculata]|uniref:Uncharacterized protein n=1 Tax=Cavenderia fasciculata TaxID=261658 RepID=F4Q9C8_CACFS|nr:uncharacterized protein DFA_10131 [Cavenderia fasciculata]EGG15297.1 hypothetical protein DFA_10131 [Cavenderia fasciculata]|eukprot:XP_004352017.1 hypothetical protein DFA_10131 [Cavenderia fasciculata]